MPTRIVPWAPDWGSGIEAELAVDDDDEGSFTVDATVEGEWSARRSAGVEIPPIVIVDGVQRVEAHGITDSPFGVMTPALLGSYAVGAVRCESGRASVLDDPAVLRVERRYFQGGVATEGDIEAGAPPASTMFKSEAVPDARSSDDLVRALGRAMLDAEASLVDELSRDESVLTIVDGPLQRVPPGRRVVGYVKRVARWYIEPPERDLLAKLQVGERTPLFRVSGGGRSGLRTGRNRLAWYVKLADFGPYVHPLATIMRLETPGTHSVEAAAHIANQCAAVLPRMASTPERDARAPQNLTPVHGLENVLRHRLGDRTLLRRLLLVAMQRPVVPGNVR